MDRPRLRPLDLFPVEVDGEVRIGARDPSGLTAHVALLPPLAAAIVALCDGTRTHDQLVAELAWRHGVRVTATHVAALVGQLDEALLLEGPRLDAARAARLDEYRAASVRAPAHAGSAYPAAAPELDALLGGHLAEAPAVPDASARVRALVAPHIDFHRGAAAYARTYRALAGAPAPEVVVVLGTDHAGADHLVTLTRKPFRTPLGDLALDAPILDRLERAGGPAVYADELHHRHEHSIELQAVCLRHLFGDATPALVPVLCGSMHRQLLARGDPARDPEVERYAEALAEGIRGRRVLLVAGGDLAHVGPRFGDPAPLDPAARAALAAADRESLAAAAALDAGGFFETIRADGDRRRVCGLAPIYLLLRVLELAGGAVAGAVAAYDQCAADEAGGSLVSVAGIVYPAAA